MEIKKFPGFKINQKLETNNGKTKVTGNLKTVTTRSRSARTPMQTEETR